MPGVTISNGVTVQYGDTLAVTRTARTVTPINNAQVETGVVKFGSGALELDGVNDALSFTPTVAFTTSTSAFTIECWVYPTSTTGARTILHLGNETFGRFIFAIFNNVLVVEQFAVATVTGNITVPLNQWSHVAFVGTGTGLNSIQMYTNGTQNSLSGSATWTQIGNGALSYIGAGGSLENDYVGYIDEFRISNIQRYTSNFTPPTQPFTNDANTLLLLHMDGTNGSTSFPDDNQSLLPIAGITVSY
jgi:hypothetical protein